MNLGYQSVWQDGAGSSSCGVCFLFFSFTLEKQAAANRASSNLAGAILLMEKLAEWVFHTTHYTSERAARVTHQIVLDYNGLAMLCLSQGKQKLLLFFVCVCDFLKDDDDYDDDEFAPLDAIEQTHTHTHARTLHVTAGSFDASIALLQKALSLIEPPSLFWAPFQRDRLRAVTYNNAACFHKR
jgi:hypothetical protein